MEKIHSKFRGCLYGAIIGFSQINELCEVSKDGKVNNVDPTTIDITPIQHVEIMCNILKEKERIIDETIVPLLVKYYSKVESESKTVTGMADYTSYVYDKSKSAKMIGLDSVLRVIPIAITILNQQKMFTGAVISSQLTHHDNRCSVAASFLCGILYLNIFGTHKRFEETDEIVQNVVRSENKEDYCFYKILDDLDEAEIDEQKNPLQIITLIKWCIKKRKCKLYDFFDGLLEYTNIVEHHIIAGAIWGSYNGDKILSVYMGLLNETLTNTQLPKFSSLITNINNFLDYIIERH